MADQTTTTVLSRLQGLLNRGEELDASAGRLEDYEFDAQLHAFRAQFDVFLEDYFDGHTYARYIRETMDQYEDYKSLFLPNVLPLLGALMSDIQAGYLTTYRERIHADVSGDFLTMAEYLLSEAYKDPAAVLLGGVLEQHLRQLCAKHEIPAEIDTEHGPRHKRADQLNSDLAREQVYSGLDQKQITAWLDLRNKAAHGKYDEYNVDQVSLMLQGVRGFVTRYPA